MNSRLRKLMSAFKKKKKKFMRANILNDLGDYSKKIL